MSENLSAVSSPVTVRHRHPWTLEEKMIIGFLLAIPVALITIHMTTSAFNLALLIGATAAAVVGAVGLYYLGWSRKKTSELVATLDGTTLTVTGNKLPNTNKLDLVTVKTVRSEVVGINPTFFLSSDDKVLRVPLRVAKKPPVKDALLGVFESAKVEASAQNLITELEKS